MNNILITITRSNTSYELRFQFFQFGLILSFMIWQIFQYSLRDYNYLFISLPITFFWVFIWIYIEYKNQNTIIFFKNHINIDSKNIGIMPDDSFLIDNSAYFQWSLEGMGNFVRVYSIYFISKEHGCKFRLYSSVWKRKTEKLFREITSLYNLEALNEIKKGNIKIYRNFNVEPINMEDN